MRLRFFIAVLSLHVLVNFYMGWHGWVWLRQVMELERTGFVIYLTVIILAAAAYLISMIPSKWLPRTIRLGMRFLGSVWFAVMLYATLILVVVDVVAVIVWFTNIAWSTYIAFAGWSALLALATIMVIGLWNAWRPVVREYKITVNKQPPGLKRLRIVAASDLHLGHIVRRSYLDVLVSRVNALKPDIVLLPGDVLDNEVTPFIEQQMGERLGKFQSRYGTFAILGNHEYYGGQLTPYEAELRACGVRLLQDEHVDIGQAFYVVGRKDKTAEQVSGGRASVQELVENLDHTKPIILLDHQPHKLEQAAEAGVDIQLSGHTHRGQMAPSNLVTQRLFELDWGYLRKGALHVIVSSGYGTWGPPIRIGSRSEIICLDVTFGKS